MIPNTDRKGELFVISGPSGTGKGTICKKLVAEYNIGLSVSATTREPRKGEKEGINYYFMNRSEFETMIEDGGFLEYAEVYGNFYGTPKGKVVQCLEAGEDIILEIDIQGAMKVKSHYPNGIFIFILPPSISELESRLKKRGTDSPESIATRLEQTVSEISQIWKYDYYVVNDDIDTAVEEVKAIIQAERLKVSGREVSIISKFEEEK